MAGEQLRQPHRVDSRDRDMGPDAEHDQREQQEYQPLLQVAVLLAADVGKCVRHQGLGLSSAGLASDFFSFFGFFGACGLGSMTSTLPPAPSMAARAPF